MATYQYEARLRARAGQFLNVLKKAGLDASIVDDSIREYSIKVSVCQNGNDLGMAVIYYSPKSDSFSLKTHELKDKSIAPTLEQCWLGAATASQPKATEFEIYVDGSYADGTTGYGAVILKNGKVVEELSGQVEATEVSGTRQVAGELAAVKAALAWCVTHLVSKVSIYYDYLGIEKWATSAWKANQPLTREYARYVAESPINIVWHKVASHTGNKWNDRADALAKLGAGSSPLTADSDELVSELVKKTEAWIDFLMVRGIEASFDRVYNEQYARVYILDKDKAVGTFDLYNTKKKRFSPYLHNFGDENLKHRIEAFWGTFALSQL